MRALRFYDQRDLRLEDIPVPAVKPNELRIKVKAAGLSQTQINEFIDGPFIINKEPHPLTGKAAPLIPCQEFGGVVDQVGKNVDQSWIGKQVAILPLIACGKCNHCKNHQEQHCIEKAYCGLVGADGGFAEYAVVPSTHVFPCERDDILTFMEPLLVGIHVLNKIKHYTHAKNVLVLGAGAVGCAIAAVCQNYGELDVTITDVLTTRIQQASQIGLNGVAVDSCIKQFDVVIDAAGHDLFTHSPGFIQGLGQLNSGGTLISVGTYFQPIQWVPAQLLAGEFNVISSFMYCSADVALLDDVISAIPQSFEPLISRIPFEQIIEQGYYRAEVDKSSFTRLEVEFG